MSKRYALSAFDSYMVLSLFANLAFLVALVASMLIASWLARPMSPLLFLAFNWRPCGALLALSLALVGVSLPLKSAVRGLGRDKEGA